MSINGHVFPQFMIGVSLGDINLNGGTWKMALGDAAGPIALTTSGIATAKLFTDWTAIVTEITGTGYTAGGATVSGLSFSAGGTDDAIATFTTATNPSWSTASFTANQAVLYESSAGTYQLGAFWDFGGAVTVSGSTFTLSINANGLLTATAS